MSKGKHLYSIYIFTVQSCTQHIFSDKHYELASDRHTLELYICLVSLLCIVPRATHSPVTQRLRLRLG